MALGRRVLAASSVPSPGADDAGAAALVTCHTWIVMEVGEPAPVLPSGGVEHFTLHSRQK